MVVRSSEQNISYVVNDDWLLSKITYKAMTFITLKIWPDIDTSAIVYYLSHACFNKKHMCILCLPTYGKHENGQCVCIWTKVIYPKYSKHWPYTVAHTIDC